MNEPATQREAPQRPRKGPDGRWYIPGADAASVQASLDATLSQRQLEDLAAILKTKPGRRWLFHLVRYCRTDDDLTPFGGAFAGEQGARVQQAIIGMRHVGLWLRQQIREATGPEMLEQMRADFEDLAPDRAIEVSAQ